MRLAWGSHENPEFNDALADWAAVHIGLRAFQAPYTTMGVYDGAELIAVVVFNNFSRSNGTIEMHMAAVSKRWLMRPVMLDMATYIFEQLGCQSGYCRADASETRIMRMLLAYGFDRFILPRMRGRDMDEAMYIIHDDAWTGNRFNKENASGRIST